MTTESVPLSPDEARYLADLLNAEIDIIGTDRCDEHGIDSVSLLERLAVPGASDGT